MCFRDPRSSWFSRLSPLERAGVIALGATGAVVLGVCLAPQLASAMVGGAAFGAASHLLGATHVAAGILKAGAVAFAL